MNRTVSGSFPGTLGTYGENVGDTERVHKMGIEGGRKTGVTGVT